MIDGIRRRLGRQPGQDPWNAGGELSPEPQAGADPPTDPAVLVAATGTAGHYAPDDASTPDFYKRLVQTAIEHGGKHGEHRIPLPWLRMTLAGLEFKRVDPEAMWDGESSDGGDESSFKIPSYGRLFPSEGAI